MIIMESYKRGQTLLIELKNGEIYEGLLHSQNESCISLCSIIEYPSGSYYDNVQNYFLNEIKLIRIIDEKNDSSESTSTISSRENLNLSSEKQITMDLNEYKRLTKMINEIHYTVIVQVDTLYYEVMKNLNSHTVIGVDAKNIELGRANKISILIIATLDKVYVFDIQRLSRIGFDGGLRDILQSKFIMKVVHDCRSLADCLLHSHKVRLNNVFDTQVGDLMLQENQGNDDIHPRSLSFCLTHYFHLPTSLFENNSKINKWNERPLPQYLKDIVAINATFLISLRNEIDKKMNFEFFSDVEQCISSLRKNP